MKKRAAKFFTVILISAMLTGILWAGFSLLDQEFLFWNGSLIPREAKTVDISGKRARNLEAFLELPNLRLLDARDTRITAAQHAWLTENLPRCTVLWDIPIQGRYFPQDTAELMVSSLTEEEITLLQQFPSLSRIDVGQWGDYPRIQALKDLYPDCSIHYQVAVGSEYWDCETVCLMLENAGGAELLEKLAYFPRLESVLLTGAVPDTDTLQTLQETYPSLLFLWNTEFMGLEVAADQTELDLSGVNLTDGSELEALLPYLPKLERLNLGSCAIPQETLATLARAYPNIHFLFDLTIGGQTVHTSAQELDLSNIPFASVEEVEALLPCFHDLRKVVMCECGISSEEMDALNRRHENIRFIWSVDLGGVLFRTDAVHFTPNRWGLKLTNENIYDLRYCTDMVCVDIGHAKEVTNCEWAAFMPELKYLVLAETGISDISPLEGLENLVFLELFLSKVKDYSPLLTCTALEDLNLCYTYGNADPIGQMTWLKRVWWSGWWQAQNKLPKRLTNTELEFHSVSSTGEGWREGQHYYDMRDFIGMEYMTG